MTKEYIITAPKTYATADNARKAIAKTGDSDKLHIIMKDPATGRFFPLFIVKPDSLAETGLHFRWNVIGA